MTTEQKARTSHRVELVKKHRIQHGSDIRTAIAAVDSGWRPDAEQALITSRQPTTDAAVKERICIGLFAAYDDLTIAEAEENWRAGRAYGAVSSDGHREICETADRIAEALNILPDDTGPLIREWAERSNYPASTKENDHDELSMEPGRSGCAVGRKTEGSAMAAPSGPRLVDSSPDLRARLEEVEPKVFLDCDGVLADFDAHALAYFGKPPRQAEREMGSAEFWRQLEARGDLYRSMPVMEGGRELYEGVKHLHPTILTGCPRGDWAQGQKVAWAAEHFPGVPIITCRSADKRDYAKPGDVLIDDWPQHRHRWIEMGGIFIVHHDAATSLAALWAHYPQLRLALNQEGSHD